MGRFRSLVVVGAGKKLLKALAGPAEAEGVEILALANLDAVLDLKTVPGCLLWKHDPAGEEALEALGEMLEGRCALGVLLPDTLEGSLKVRVKWPGPMDLLLAEPAALLEYLGLARPADPASEETAAVLEVEVEASEELPPPLPPELPVQAAPVAEPEGAMTAPEEDEDPKKAAARLRRENSRLLGQVETLKKRLEETLEKQKELTRNLRNLEGGGREAEAKELERLTNEGRRLRERLATLEQRHETQEQARVALASELAEARKAREDLREELEGARARLSEQDGALTRAGAAVADQESKLHRLEELGRLNRQLIGEAEEHQANLLQYRRRAEELTEQLAQAEAKKAALEGRIETMELQAMEDDDLKDRFGADLQARNELLSKLKLVLEETVARAEALEAKVAGLEAKVAELEPLAEAGGKVPALEAKVAELEPLAAAGGKVPELEAKVAGLEAKVAELEPLAEAGGKVPALEAKVSELEPLAVAGGKVPELEAKVAGLEAKVAELEPLAEAGGKVPALEAKVAELEPLAAAGLKVPALEAKVSELESWAAELEPLAEAGGKVPALEAKVAELEPLAAAGAKVPALEAQLATVTEARARAEDNAARLTASLETLRADYDSLEQLAEESRQSKALAEAQLAAQTLARQEAEQGAGGLAETISGLELRLARQEEARRELESRCLATAEVELQLRDQLEQARLEASGLQARFEESDAGRLAALERQDYLTRETKALQEQVAGLRAENESLGQAVKKEQDRFEEVSADLGLLEVDRRGATSAVERMGIELGLLQDQKAAVVALLGEEKARLEIRSRENEALGAKLAVLEASLKDLEALRSQKETLEGQVSELEGKLAQVAKKRETKDKEKKELTRQVEALSKESEDRRLRIEALEAELEAAISVVGQPSAQPHQTEEQAQILKALEEETVTLRGEVEGLKRSSAEHKVAALITTQSAREEELATKLSEVEMRLGYFKNEYDRSLNLLEERDHRIETLELGLARLEGEGGSGRIKKLERLLDTARDRAGTLEVELSKADNERLELALTVEKLQVDLEKALENGGPDISREDGSTETLTVTDTAELLQLRERLELLEKERSSLQSFLEESRKRVETERQLFLEVEENYRVTIMEMNNEKEDALIRLSELDERVRRLTGVQDLQHKSLLQVLGLVKAARDANQELSRTLSAAMEE